MTPALLTRTSMRLNFFYTLAINPFDGIFQRNVATPALAIGAELADLADCLLEFAARARAQRQFRAFAGVGHGDGFTDASAAARDQATLSLSFIADSFGLMVFESISTSI